MVIPESTAKMAYRARPTSRWCVFAMMKLKVRMVCLLTNNPDKIIQLQALDIDVVESMPLVAGVGDDNREYLITKVERMGHSINTDELN